MSTLAGLAFALIVAASAPQPDPTRPVVMTVPGMDRVRVRRDVVYEKVGGTELLADVYLPPEDGKGTRAPVVVFQAGGAENTKDWASYTSLSRLFAASGFAAVPFGQGYLLWSELLALFEGAGWRLEVHGWPGRAREITRDLVEIARWGRRTARFPILIGRRDG